MNRNPTEEEDRRAKNRRAFILFSALFFIFMVAVSFFRDKGFIKVIETETELRELKERVRSISQENDRFTREILALKTHQGHYVERVAREELGLVKEGEIVYEFITEDRFWKK